MNDCQALSSEKRFLSARRGFDAQPSDLYRAVTIELPRLRWWVKVQVRHMCDLSESHYMLMILMKFVLKLWELGDISRWEMNDRQALPLEKRLQSPRLGSNPQPSDDWCAALTIELPRLRWWPKVQVRHVWPKWKSLYVNDINEICLKSVTAWRYLDRIDERSSSSILRKQFLSARRGSNPQPQMVT